MSLSVRDPLRHGFIHPVSIMHPVCNRLWRTQKHANDYDFLRGACRLGREIKALWKIKYKLMWKVLGASSGVPAKRSEQGYIKKAGTVREELVGRQSLENKEDLDTEK